SFFTLNDHDLKNMGITSAAHRAAILNVKNHLIIVRAADMTDHVESSSGRVFREKKAHGSPMTPGRPSSPASPRYPGGPCGPGGQSSGCEAHAHPADRFARDFPSTAISKGCLTSSDSMMVLQASFAVI
ncbi:hypothetical protein ANCDUO_18741, partial [Ancylostoma duodenale]